MRTVLKPLPVLYACAGCAEFGRLAGDVAQLLDARRLVESASLGAADSKPGARFPIFTLDGCDQACAQRWLERSGATAERTYILVSYDPRSARYAAQQIAADLGSPT